MGIHKKALEYFLIDTEAILSIAVKSIIILIIGLLILKILLAVVQRVLKRSKLDPSLYVFIANIIKVLGWIFIIISICGIIGINTNTFVAVLGAAGAAIALALKDSLANIAGGIIIIVTKPFKMGDDIDIGETAGIVQEIDLMCTRLKTYDNQAISVPNGKITTSVLKNATTEAVRRVDLVFPIAYEDDFQELKKTLLKLVMGNEDIFSQPEPFVGITNHKDGIFEVSVRVWCYTEKYWNIRNYIEENVKTAFNEAGIAMPLAKMEIVNKNN